MTVKIVILTNFVVVSSVGIKKVVCIHCDFSFISVSLMVSNLSDVRWFLISRDRWDLVPFPQ